MFNYRHHPSTITIVVGAYDSLYFYVYVQQPTEIIEVVYIYIYIYIHICVCVCVCVCVHISDCVEIVCELLLLPNNTTSETFLHKSGAVRSVD